MSRLRTPLGVRIVAALSAIFAALGVAAYVTGRQTSIDIVGVVKHSDNVELEESLIPTNGIKLNVIQAGPKDGPPVVLLHGYPEFWFAWHAQIVRLAKAGFRVIVPDQRGYDASDKPRGVAAYRIENMVADVIGLIQTMGYERVDLAGHDWGGAIAWYLVIEHPERFRRLVMFNAPHPLAWVDANKSGEHEQPINWFRTFFQIPTVPEVVGYANNWSLLTNSLRNTSRPGTFSDDDLALYRWAWFRDGAAHSMVNWYRAAFQYPHKVDGDGLVQIPTRIVWGMQDRFFDNRMGRFSAAHCANGELIEVANAGHWLLHEEPEMTSQKIVEFLQ